MAKVDKAKRRAASFVVFHLFHNMLGIRHILSELILQEVGKTGLTENEREYLLKRTAAMNEIANDLRDFGWRLRKSS